MSNLYCVYRLIDPRDGYVFYIGQSSNPERREQKHLNTGNDSFKKNASKAQMVKDIKNVGLQPIFEIMCENVLYENIDKLETGMISLHHLMGCYLTNKEIGGHAVSEWTRKKISESLSGKNHPLFGMFGEDHPAFGRIPTEEQKQVQSQKMKGKYDGENNPFFGKKHTDETKKLQSKARKGKKFTEEHKKNISIAFTKFTNLTKEYLIENYINQNKTVSSIAKENGCVKGTVRTKLKTYGIIKQNKFEFLTKEFLIEEYINKNKSIPEIEKEFNFKTSKPLYTNLKKFNIKKEKYKIKYHK